MTDQFDSPGDLSSSDLEARIGDLFDDPDFLSVHRQISPFNFFEAVGAIRAELRHSNFLAYLLSPSRPHGLGAKPLAAVLRAILTRLPASKRPVMALELIAGELDDAIVYRERDNIDILIELPTLKLVIAIENKIDAKAHDGQLGRYSEQLRSAFGGYRKLLVFLTPDGNAPDHEEYVAYDYLDLVETLESITEHPLEPIPSETLLIIRHYVDMVRRHIVQDDRLRALALTLYERHKEAFDFIFECRPEPRSLLTVARECVQGVEGLIVDSAGSNLFRFLPAVWDERLTTIKGDPKRWSKTGRGILFEVKTYGNAPGRVNIALILGPGDPTVRSRVYKTAARQPDLFVGLVKPMGDQWATIFSRDLLTQTQAKNLSFEAQANNISLGWSDFQGRTLQRLIDAVLGIDEQLATPQNVD